RLYNNGGQGDFNKIESWELYLAAGVKLFGFWTGGKIAGGPNISKGTPIDINPLNNKEGSILPIGPNVQYATEKKWDNLELKVYTGANGSFTLYEDEFDNYNYENGAYTEIPITWDNSKKTLTIGERKGAYNEMLSNRKFTVILDDGTSKIVPYKGKKVVIKF